MTYPPGPPQHRGHQVWQPPPDPQQWAPPPAPKKTRKWPWVVGGIVVLGMFGSCMSSFGQGVQAGYNSAVAPTTVAAPTVPAVAAAPSTTTAGRSLRMRCSMLDRH